MTVFYDIGFDGPVVPDHGRMTDGIYTLFSHTDSEFVSQAEKYSYEIDISVDESVINAKSLVGMLSKGFRRMMRMDIHAES